ncbi:MAG: hypothetical protein HQL84_17680 [Magnetococcales bacterium]|nr:hypothetical protein [Magnetococcales bacterium]
MVVTILEGFLVIQVIAGIETATIDKIAYGKQRALGPSPQPPHHCAIKMAKKK